MKRLFLVRHGKSSWKYDLPDEERPLKKRAYKDAEVVIKALKAVLDKPVTLWSSYAARALNSAKIFRDELQIEDDNFQVKDELYTFDKDKLIEVVQSSGNEVDQLMIFGHNPAVTEAVNSLGDTHFDNVPTTGLTLIEFETDTWKDLNRGKTILYLFPKNLR